MAKKKILIIDDEPAIAQLVKEKMEFVNYEVIIASNGTQGLKMAQKEKPNIILLDVIMPDMHGFELCKILKENPKTKKIPIIVTTGAGLEDIARDEPEVKADAYLAKPFDFKKLAKAIENLI